jgi:hypothetical protein
MGDCHGSLLEGLAQDLQDVAAARRPLIQPAHVRGTARLRPPEMG